MNGLSVNSVYSFEPKYFVYRHIREDKNEPFYIGIGTYTKHKNYGRATTTSHRNHLWNEVFSNTTHRVEIIFEAETYKEVHDKEKEFIAIYGRQNKGTGTLVNLNNGGQGLKDYIVSDATKAKEKQLAIVGSISVKENGCFYNRLYWVMPNGSYQFYNKRHLF